MARASGGDEQVAAQHRRSLRSTLFGIAGAEGAMGIVNLVVNSVGSCGTAVSSASTTAAAAAAAAATACGASAPPLISGIHALLGTASSWLLWLVPVGGGLLAGYHWFMTGPGAGE